MKYDASRFPGVNHKSETTNIIFFLNKFRAKARDKRMAKKIYKARSASVESRNKIGQILNDINEKNFSNNVKKVKELAVDYQIILNLVFEKATVSDNPRAKMYARLCQELQTMQVPGGDGNKPEKIVNFRKLIISRLIQ